MRIRKVLKNFLHKCFRVSNTHEFLSYTIFTECVAVNAAAAAAVHIKNKCFSSLVTNLNLTLISPHFLCACALINVFSMAH